MLPAARQLESRGSLHAIFGADGWEALGERPAGGLAFEWHVGLLPHAGQA